MKRLLVSIPAILTFIIMQAQPQQGKLFVGGELGIYTSSNKEKQDGSVTGEQSFTVFSLLPKAGYFMSDRVAAGLQTGISSSVSRIPGSNPDKRSATYFLFEPFGRYYFTSGAGGIFAEVGLGLSAGKSKSFFEVNTVESNETVLSIDIGPGFYYYITPSIALEAKFGLAGFSTNIQKSGDQKTISNEFLFQLYPSGISFGATFIL